MVLRSVGFVWLVVGIGIAWSYHLTGRYRQQPQQGYGQAPSSYPGYQGYPGYGQQPAYYQPPPPAPTVKTTTTTPKPTTTTAPVEYEAPEIEGPTTTVSTTTTTTTKKPTTTRRPPAKHYAQHIPGRGSGRYDTYSLYGNHYGNHGYGRHWPQNAYGPRQNHGPAPTYGPRRAGKWVEIGPPNLRMQNANKNQRRPFPPRGQGNKRFQYPPRPKGNGGNNGPGPTFGSQRQWNNQQEKWNGRPTAPSGPGPKQWQRNGPKTQWQGANNSGVNGGNQQWRQNNGPPPHSGGGQQQRRGGNNAYPQQRRLGNNRGNQQWGGVNTSPQQQGDGGFNGNNRRQQNRPQQNRPQQSRPQHNRPQQNRPQQNRPQQNRPQQNRPQQNRQQQQWNNAPAPTQQSNQVGNNRLQTNWNNPSPSAGPSPAHQTWGQAQGQTQGQTHGQPQARSQPQVVKDNRWNNAPQLAPVPQLTPKLPAQPDPTQNTITNSVNKNQGFINSVFTKPPLSAVEIISRMKQKVKSSNSFDNVVPQSGSWGGTVNSIPRQSAMAITTKNPWDQLKELFGGATQAPGYDSWGYPISETWKTGNKSSVGKGQTFPNTTPSMFGSFNKLLNFSNPQSMLMTSLLFNNK